MEFPIRKIYFAPDRWRIRFSPQFVYAQGMPEAFAVVEALPDRGLAVVGTRHAQPRAEILVRSALADLSESELVILSGLALGIDACAHEAAIEAGLSTIAILGCGLGLQYPKENEALRQRILENGGLVLSEYEMDQEARPHHFLQRNRLISGFAKASWIAQAPARSGALNTARWARDEHRDCYATPSFPGDPTMAGTQKLIDDESAIPFWGAHSLGQTWLELSTAGRQTASASQAPSQIPGQAPADEDPLIHQIRCHTAQAGGISLESLLDWAMSHGLTPVECFERLQKAQQCGRVSEKGGVFATV